MFSVWKREWKAILIQAIVGAVFLISILVGLSALTGQFNIEKRIQRENATAHALICKVAVAANPGNEAVARICAPVLADNP